MNFELIVLNPEENIIKKNMVENKSYGNADLFCSKPVQGIRNIVI